jgi:hypothetical protein
MGQTSDLSNRGTGLKSEVTCMKVFNSEALITCTLNYALGQKFGMLWLQNWYKSATLKRCSDS